MKKMNQRLVVTYPAKYWPDADPMIEKAVGHDCYGSGMGFGTRDMEFRIPASKVDKIRNQIAKLGIPDVTVMADD